jgi:hypothetical protein
MTCQCPAGVGTHIGVAVFERDTQRIPRRDF